MKTKMKLFGGLFTSGWLTYMMEQRIHEVIGFKLFCCYMVLAVAIVVFIDIAIKIVSVFTGKRSDTDVKIN